MQVDVLLEHIQNETLELNDFDGRNFFTDDIIKKMLGKNLVTLGKGAVGKVYLINNHYVIKQIIPCDTPKDKPLRRYCEDVLKSKGGLPLIPGGGGKYRYVLPNLFSEAFIGMLLGRLSVGFGPTLGSVIVFNKDEDDLEFYIIMQKLQPFVINNKINLNYKEFICMLFQVSHALLTAQQQYRFTHYDLHIDNVLWDENKTFISYPLPNNKRIVIKQKDCPFIIKMTDFALSRLQVYDKIISPLVDDFPTKTYGEFNPSYDILFFLGSIVIDDKLSKYFDDVFKNVKIYNFVLKLMLWIFKDTTINNKDLKKLKDEIAKKYYQKKGKKPNVYSFRPLKIKEFIPYVNVRSMVEIVNYLGNELLNIGIKNNSKGEGIIIPRFKEYEELGDIELYDPHLDIETFPGKGHSISTYQTMTIDEGIIIKKFHVYTNIPPHIYNFTVESDQTLLCPLQDQYITAVFINHQIKNYNFSFECCKIDPPNFMLQNKKIGFVVNGGFFSVKKDFLPIGIYRDEYNIIEKYKIPKRYKDVYGHIVIKDNVLTIKRKVKDNEKVLTSGPLMIENGKVVFDPNEDRFKCTEEKYAQDLILKNEDDGITVKGYYKYKREKNGFSCVKEFVPHIKKYERCDKIDPGDLTHADNPNPRTAFCILKNGDYVFLTFEGRGNRGNGVDLFTLANAIMGNFKDVMVALNLDGGRSSNFAWRTKDEPNKVYLSNPDRMYYYPSGNIIALLKK